jgi:hypothetical protein
MLEKGISSASVVAAINSLPSPAKEAALIEWEYAILFEREKPLVAALGSILGISHEELDGIWLRGKEI